MGEIVVPVIFFLVVILAGGVAMGYLHSSSRQRNSLINAPAVMMPPGESPDVLLANAVHSYALLQRAVRVLDGIKDSPSFDRATRKEIHAIVDEHYK